MEPPAGGAWKKAGPELRSNLTALLAGAAATLEAGVAHVLGTEGVLDGSDSEDDGGSGAGEAVAHGGRPSFVARCG